MLFAKGCCKWWKNVAKRIATLEFDRTRKSIGVIVKASSGSNTLLVKGAVETLLEHRSVLWVLLFGDLSWRRHVLYVPSPAWNMSPAQWTGQDERDGQEATKVSCEYIGLCFQ
ncbi:hypothetical protein BDA96_06G243700 [Sorghum bicolor]|uniref:Uncharacterized protein n=1 Tax=Sorghum bicolor TaxID=4558 RepID=A0A921QSW3_SORBI|nr:hypothetical protein BDA96_06G243700 [Sorghum bicolor]